MPFDFANSVTNDRDLAMFGVTSCAYAAGRLVEDCLQVIDIYDKRQRIGNFAAMR